MGKIRLAEIDENRVSPSGKGVLVNAFIRFTERAAPAWVSTFNDYWRKAVFYGMKRNAIASTEGVNIECVLSEIPQYHFQELQSAIEEVNKIMELTEAKHLNEEAIAKAAEQKLKEEVRQINRDL